MREVKKVRLKTVAMLGELDEEGRVKARRVQAHVPVRFLACLLYKTLEHWQNRAGLTNTSQTVLEEFARNESPDVSLPRVDGRTLRTRSVIQSDRPQSILIQCVGLEPPH